MRCNGCDADFGEGVVHSCPAGASTKLSGVMTKEAFWGSPEVAAAPKKSSAQRTAGTQLELEFGNE